MGKIFLIFGSLIFASFVSLGQEHYYWSINEKHYLKVSTDKYIVELSGNEDTITKELIKIDWFNKISRLKGNLKMINTDSSSLEKLKKHDGVKKVMPAYKLGNIPIYLTGEILLQPKSGVKIEELLKIIGNRAIIKHQSKYNTFTLKTEYWDKLFDYSNQIYESGLVEYCHPNFIATRERFEIIDPKYGEQYYLNNTGQFGGTSDIDINAPEAWNITTGISDVTVAVIDDGVENHEDLNGRVLPGFTPQYSISNPNTYGAPNANNPTKTVYPYDSDNPFGHGECCAGIIAASHNSIGIRGIAPKAKIVPVNIFNDWFVDIMSDSYGNQIQFINYAEDAQDIANAIDFSWDDAKADIISNSWGYNSQNVVSDAIVAAIGRARNQGRNGLGSVVIFASGNSNQNFPGVTFPANVNGVISVGAIDKNGNIWDYSSRGPEMDLVAPSGGSTGDVRTIDREGNKGFNIGNYVDNFNGTSAACPQVSGVAALMVSINPSLTENQISTILQQTATDMGTSGFDNIYGYGRVNAYAAVNAIYPALSGSGALCSGETATYSISNLPQGATVTWYANGLSLNTTTGASTTASTLQGAGAGYIRATITSSNGTLTLTKEVALNGYTPIIGPDFEYLSNKKAYFEIDTQEPSVWSVNGDTFTSMPYSNRIVVPLYQYYPGSVLITCAVNSSCGHFEARKDFQIIGDEEALDAYSIYPNPTSTSFSIKQNEELQAMSSTLVGDAKSQDNLSILIYNDQSQLLRQQKVYLNQAVSIDNLREGLYIIHIKDGKKVHKKKLIIRRN